MPAKNTVKTYVEGGYYHLYNRGVEKRNIFLNTDDYHTFLNLLKIYLSQQPKQRSDLETARYIKKNLYGKIELLAYCLMPNHIHLLVRQTTRDGISNLMQCLSTSYVGYFNKKYERVGTLFQGKFKAVLVESDSYLLHLSRYIHLNPMSLNEKSLVYYYSSYLDYIGKRSTTWLNTQIILEYFKNGGRLLQKSSLSYQDFVADYKAEAETLLKDLVLEED